jgi:nicotinate dehydrogenase subunit B
VPAQIEANPRLATWLTTADGHVEVTVGKVELGQGILTALHQIAADALALPLDLVRIRSARTDGPDQGLTAGSLSVLQSTPALRYLGAAVRQLAEAPADLAPGETSSYVDRIAELDPHTDLTGFAVVATPGPTRAVGTDAPRIDLPD